MIHLQPPQLSGPSEDLIVRLNDTTSDSMYSTQNKMIILCIVRQIINIS